MLVDIAYERIKRLVRGDADADNAEEPREEEEEEESEPWSRPMLAILRREVQSQVVSWLYTYISCKSGPPQAFSVNQRFKIIKPVRAFKQLEMRGNTNGNPT